jgi:uncharacterized coiled-coil protein SlyX
MKAPAPGGKIPWTLLRLPIMLPESAPARPDQPSPRTIIHLGARRGERVPGFHAAGARRIILAEPKPGLAALYPGLRQERLQEVGVLSPQSLLRGLEPPEHPLLLVIEAPGGEMALLETWKAAGLLEQADQIELRCGEEVFHAGATAHAGIEAWLAEESFALTRRDMDDPDWPVLHLQIDRTARARAKALAGVEARITDLEQVVAAQARALAEAQATIRSGTATVRELGGEVESLTARNTALDKALSEAKAATLAEAGAGLREQLARLKEEVERGQFDLRGARQDLGLALRLRARHAEALAEKARHEDLLHQLTPAPARGGPASAGALAGRFRGRSRSRAAAPERQDGQGLRPMSRKSPAPSAAHLFSLPDEALTLLEPRFPAPPGPAAPLPSLLERCKARLARASAPGPARRRMLIKIGTTRERVPGQGSTEKLARVCAAPGMEFITVDMDARNSAMALHMFRCLGLPFRAVTAKGEDFLAAWKGPVDYCFLDAYDFDHGQHSELRQSRYETFLGSRISDAQCHQMHLDCARSLAARLAGDGMICFDDTWTDAQDAWTAKGATAMPFLLEQGFRITDARNRAALLVRG